MSFLDLALTKIQAYDDPQRRLYPDTIEATEVIEFPDAAIHGNFSIHRQQCIDTREQAIARSYRRVLSLRPSCNTQYACDVQTFANTNLDVTNTENNPSTAEVRDLSNVQRFQLEWAAIPSWSSSASTPRSSS